MKKEKVYCKNCKYRRNYSNQGGGEEDRCARKKPKELYNKYNGKFNDYQLFSMDTNKEGSCEYYKKKWWKFWLI